MTQKVVTAQTVYVDLLRPLDDRIKKVSMCEMGTTGMLDFSKMDNKSGSNDAPICLHFPGSGLTKARIMSISLLF